MCNPGDGFAILYTSPSEYEKLCLEIYYDQHCVAEITQEEGKEKAKIFIYAPPEGQEAWEFSLKELKKCLANALEGLDPV